MNPAQLLNPKAYAKRKKSEQEKPGAGKKRTPNGERQQQSPPQPRMQTFDPSSLLNPRAAASSKTTRDEHNAEQQSINSEPDSHEGMGSLIERMHNVQNREAQTPRKRKLEIELEDEQPKKSTFHAHARNGGVIGDHLKKEREQIAASPSIDLTKDDEEVVFLKETKPDKSSPNEEVILGQFSSKAMVHRIPDVSDRAKSAIGADHWPRIKVNWRFTPGSANNNIIELVTKSGMFFGKIDFKTAQALTPLLKSIVGCNFITILESRPKQKSEQAGMSVSMSLSLVCILSAPRGKALNIGKYLSQKQIFLSAPTALGGVHKEYDNPQLPKDLRPVTSGDPSQQRKAQLQGSIAVTTRTVEELQRDTKQLIDSLVKHEDLPEVEGDSSLISTKLMAHQKQALYFLTEHEQPDQSVTLWKEDRNAKGQDYWYHVVTGHQSDKKPEPLQGGILADVMGLGKTLSILALIASDASDAKLFGRQQGPDPCERNVRSTLIICPKSVVANWTEQIAKHTVPGKFRVYKYHGQSRTQEADELAKYHIVLTTYSTASAEFSAKNKPLAAINWYRIVLDEAHSIRNTDTNVFKACVALHASRRWAVTGTPVQNGLNDLGALIRFLKVKPFDQGSTWNQYIMAPFKLANPEVVQHLRLLVDSITLRRLKDTVDTTVKTINIVRLQHTEEEQKWYAKVAGESSKKLKVMTANNSLKGKSYAHVLKSIGTLRMLCAHGLDMFSEEDRAEIKEGADAANAIDLGDEPEFDNDWQFISERNAYENLQMMSDSDVDRCNRCNNKIVPVKDKDGAEPESEESTEDEAEEEKKTLGYLTPCFHLICTNCKDDHVDETRKLLTADDYHKCQYCDSYIRFGLFELLATQFDQFLDARNAKIKTPKGRKWDESSYTGPHTKVVALLNDLRASAAETAALPEGEPPIRSVVFSGWTSYLDLIEVALDAEGIGFARLDGTMSLKQRAAALDAFANNPTTTVLLISIKAGGQGLNLIAGSKVYMMEPQFNPGIEEQAVDRVHRLGQKRNVEVKRYIMTNTIEEGILNLQAKKKSLADLSMDRKMNAQQIRKEQMENIKALFK